MLKRGEHQILEGETFEIGQKDVAGTGIVRVTTYQSRSVVARLQPLKKEFDSTLSPETANPKQQKAEFSVKDTGKYSVNLLYNNSLDQKELCTLMPSFTIACSSAEGYVEQGTRCVPQCEAIGTRNVIWCRRVVQMECCTWSAAGYNGDECTMSLHKKIIGGVIGALICLALIGLLYYIKKDRNSLRRPLACPFSPANGFSTRPAICTF